MACECHSGQRTLAIMADQLAQRYPELWDFSPGAGWEVVPELQAIRVELGPGLPWQSPTEVVHLLRTLVGPQRVHGLRAGWVPGRGDFADAVRRLTDPPFLTDLAPRNQSPLLSILENRAIETWYQPIFTAEGYELWGVECLLRARDAEGEILSPAQMFKWARQERLTFMLDRLCRERHIENAGRAQLPEHAAVLINFLPTAIYDPGFCLRTTEAAAARSGLDPRRIIFEVVESEEVADREHLATILARYRRGGFRVAIDDVGAGYAGLMMLADLNPDLIKIDRELVRKAPSSKIHRTICAALVTMGRENQKLVLAEGVETAQEHATMDRIGVDLYQGYRFGKPAPMPVTRPLKRGLRLAG